MNAASPAQLDRLAAVAGSGWAGQRPSSPPEPPLRLVHAEVRLARARLAHADCELQYIDCLLQANNINASGALQELDRIMSEFEVSP